MGPVLGVEGGGSHSHAVVVEGPEALLGIGANDDPANWEDVGIEAAGAALRSCIREALDAAGVRPELVSSSVFTLAGVDFPMDEQRLSGIPAALGLTGPCRIMNDSFAGLRAGTDEPFGAVVIAGTGSVVAGRNPDGEEFRTLGLGPLLGDSGSASEVSEAGVTAVALAFLGRGPETLLTDLLCDATGFASTIEFLEAAGRDRIDTSTYSPIVVRAAEEGDEVAEEILTHAGEMLGATAAYVLRHLNMESVPFDLVLAGGLFRARTAGPVRALEASIRPVAPEARLVKLEDPPVVGAALLAMELAGGTPLPGTRTSLGRAVTSALGLAGGTGRSSDPVG
jgi:N-acetylglucosamine kinase-like BadF-type ATPase